MRVIKLGLISLVVFAIILTTISLFFPSRVRISRALDMRAKRNVVMNKISHANNWKEWYPGADTMELWIQSGNTKGLLIDGGKGQISIVETTDTTVLARTSGTGIRKMTTGWNVFPAGVPDSLTVQWFMDIKLSWYPWEKFSSMLLEKKYGPTMEKGLENLKGTVEAKKMN